MITVGVITKIIKNMKHPMIKIILGFPKLPVKKTCFDPQINGILRRCWNIQPSLNYLNLAHTLLVLYSLYIKK